MANFKNINESVIFHIPETKEEITREYVDEVLKEVKLSEHYAIVGLIYMGSLAELTSVKSTKISVIPILCKFNSDKFKDEDIMQTVCVDRSSIERANQLYNVKNEIGLASIASFLRENKINILGKGYNAVAIEFKVMPVTDIKAIIGKSDKHKNFFKHTQSLPNTANS